MTEYQRNAGQRNDVLEKAFRASTAHTNVLRSLIPVTPMILTHLPSLGQDQPLFSPRLWRLIPHRCSNVAHEPFALPHQHQLLPQRGRLKQISLPISTQLLQSLLLQIASWPSLSRLMMVSRLEIYWCPGGSTTWINRRWTMISLDLKKIWKYCPCGDPRRRLAQRLGSRAKERERKRQSSMLSSARNVGHPRHPEQIARCAFASSGRRPWRWWINSGIVTKLCAINIY